MFIFYYSPSSKKSKVETCDNYRKLMGCDTILLLCQHVLKILLISASRKTEVLTRCCLESFDYFFIYQLFFASIYLTSDLTKRDIVLSVWFWKIYECDEMTKTAFTKFVMKRGIVSRDYPPLFYTKTLTILAKN